jgi:hypothetical protein
VTVGTAAAKAASDSSKDTLASVDGATTPGHLAVFSDAEGTVEDGGIPGGVIVNAPLLSPVLTTDLVPFVRGGQIYLATAAQFLAAQAPPSGEGQYDFSSVDNSAYAAII